MSVPGVSLTMLERVPIEARDRRNFAVVVGIMTLVIAMVVEETIAVRLVVGLIMGVFSGLVFLATTIVLKLVVE